MAWINLKTKQWSDRSLGIFAILAGVLLLSFSDALVKLSGDRFGLAQIVLLRSLVAAGCLAVGLRASFGPAALRLQRSGWVWLRSLCLSAMWLCYYAALPSMSLSLAAACYYLSPVWMALVGRLCLGTVIGRYGWLAIGMSVAGVILAVNPSAETLSPMLFLPLAAGGFYALAGTITWSRCQTERAGAMALNLNLCLCIVAGIGLAGLSLLPAPQERGFAFAVWPDLGWGDWGLVALLGVLLALVTLAVAAAYRLAATPIVGVFDTAYLGFAALWGGVFFGQMPTLHETVGIGLIAAAAMVASGALRNILLVVGFVEERGGLRGAG